MKECPLCGRCLADHHDVCPDDRAVLSPLFPGPPLLDGKYRLLARLGAGGMGAVYEAHHAGLDRRVAVKLLHPGRLDEPGARERFQTEARTLARLDHPNVVKVLDCGTARDGGAPYLVMELLPALSLAELLRSGPLEMSAALPLLAEVAAALDHAHAAGILHRDLKASNVLLAAAPGGGRTAKVVDFGLAGFLADPESTPPLDPAAPQPSSPSPASGIGADSASSEAGRRVPPPWEGGGWIRGEARRGAPRRRRASVEVAAAPLLPSPLSQPTPSQGGGTPPGPSLRPKLAPMPAAGPAGTPPYLAPELWAGGAPAPAADLWSFGVLAFFTLTGRLPFPGTSREEIREQIARGAPSPASVHPGLSPALDAAILAPLSPDPAARPARAGEVVAGIDRAFLAGQRRRWLRREVPRRLALAGLLGALALAIQSPLAKWLAPVEGRLVDARFHLASPRPPRPEPLLVLFDDATLASDPALLGTRSSEVGTLLERAFAAGARGVAVDLLLPASWGDDPAFSDLVLHHPDTLVLAAASPAGRVVGTEAVHGLTAAALGPERARELFGFVDVEEDEDGVVRRARPLLRDTTGEVRPAFAARAARFLRPGLPLPKGEVWIDGTVDWRRFERISFRDLGEVLDRDPGRFRGRLVLLGGDFAGSGDESHRVLHARGLPETLPGVVLQALLVNTLLDRTPVRSPGRRWELAVLFLVAAGVATGILLGGRALATLSAPAAAAGWAGGALVLFAAHRLLMPLAPPVVALLLLAGVAALLRKRFAAPPHSLLEKP